MPQTRREFLKKTGATAVAGVMADRLMRPNGSNLLFAAQSPPSNDPEFKELTQVALNAARGAGASYADVRISATRTQSISTREDKLQDVSDVETFGFGVRALANGAWGFAASSNLNRDNVARIAKMAVEEAKANSRIQVKPVALAPVTPTADGTWRSPIQTDPFTVEIADKVALLFDANRAALAVKGARYVSSNMFFLREEKTLATTDGTYVVQTIYRSFPSLTVTAVSSDATDFQTRRSTEIAPKGLGYEHIVQSNLIGTAGKWASEAVEKLSAKSVEVGRYDLILHPTHLWLTIHESIAHPTELDRVYGYEANFAGTSFVSPPEKTLGKLKYGSSLLNIVGDRSQVGSLSAVGWDDEGVAPEDFDLIKDGILVDYQTTREQAMWLDWWYKSQGKPTRSHGCCYAQSWKDVQFQRMPNISMKPGTNETTFDNIIAATDNGIAIIGDGSFSIDQQRYNAQFGGQLCYEVKNGKIVGMLKDVAYQLRTPEFWGSMDMIGGKSSYELCGAFNDGKGQPVQLNAVSHGAVPARFQQVNVINTGSKS